MGKAKRFDSYQNDIENERKLAQSYGQNRQNLSGIGSSFRSSPLSPGLSTVNSIIDGDNLGNHTATQNLDLDGNQLIGIDKLVQNNNTNTDGFLNMLNSQSIRWLDNAGTGTAYITLNTNDEFKLTKPLTFDHSTTPTSTEVGLSNVTGDMYLNVLTNDSYFFRVNGTTEFEMDASELDCRENQLRNVSRIILDDDDDTFIAGDFYSSIGDDTVEVHTGNSLRVKIDNSTTTITNDLTIYGNTIIGLSSTETIQLTGTISTDTKLTGGKRIRSSDSTELGLFIRNETGTIGTLGTVQLPEYTATTAPSNATLDTNFGAFQGSSGIFRDTDTAAGSRFYIRGSDGNWYYSFLTQQT